MQQYMVDFFLPEFTEEFVALIPQHRLRVNKLMSRGVILSYAVSADRTRSWAMLVAKSKGEAERILRTLPLFPLIEYEMRELMFHNSVSMALPAISMN
jgi:muconolactone delta-isomerase